MFNLNSILNRLKNLETVISKQTYHFLIMENILNNMLFIDFSGLQYGIIHFMLLNSCLEEKNEGGN